MNLVPLIILLPCVLGIWACPIVPFKVLFAILGCLLLGCTWLDYVDWVSKRRRKRNADRQATAVAFAQKIVDDLESHFLEHYWTERHRAARDALFSGANTVDMRIIVRKRLEDVV